MKKYLFFILIVLSLKPAVTFSQTENNFVGPHNPGAWKKLGAVSGCIGIIDRSYYLIESDYGTRLDFNNNINTIVSEFSIDDGKVKNRFSLNELVAQTRKESNKILFCDVFQWKGNLVGFYTYKNATASKFNASAIILSPKGKVIKDNIEIGDFSHDYKNGSFLWQGGLLINGRNRLSVVKDFQYRMTPDSSKIIVLCAPPANNEGNIRFKIYDHNLTEQSDVTSTIPIQEKIADVTDFSLDNNGILYVLTRTYKSKSARKKVSKDDDHTIELHIINTNTPRQVKTLPVTALGKEINNAFMVLGAKNDLYCLGTYWDPSNTKSKGNVKGIYSLRVDGMNAKIIGRSNYDLPDSVINNLSLDKIKVANGMNADYTYYQSISGVSGTFVILTNEIVSAVVRGNTGAMNSYNEGTRTGIFTRIDTTGKISWSVGYRIYAANPEMQTRSNRPLFFVKNDRLRCLVTYSTTRDKKDIIELVSTDFSNTNGEKKILRTPLPNHAFEGRVIEKSLALFSNDEYVSALTYKSLQIMKCKIE